MAERPAFCTEEMLTYLDRLRESGSINMMGGAPCIRTQFNIPLPEAREVLCYWMDTFPRPEKPAEKPSRRRVYKPTRHPVNLNLYPDNPEDAGCTDFTLGQGQTDDNAWITVNNISVHIVRTDEGVVVDLYPKDGEMNNALAGTWLHFQDAEPDKEDGNE